MITKENIERILDSYLNVLYEAQTKGKNIEDFKKKELLKATYDRANKNSKWFCKTKYQRNNKPKWVTDI
ncbi:MAG: hypothetical protein GTO02_10050 [Candidatus Dadabacteria bacterium]|nr:hypothetical protein [Candidatus Dadabacteria bacterium]NIQ14715.1 hypothetical protein [Candidatus Dadabacteria bacterium]